jgi:hypothetical protein
VRSPNCAKGKVALASAPSASSAALLALQRRARAGLSSQPGYAGTSGLSLRVSTGSTIADGADGVFGK